MTKEDLIKAVSAASGAHKSVVDDVLAALAKVAGDQLVQRQDVTIPGVGKLTPKDRAARKGRNPKTGEEIQIPVKKVVAFKAAKALADNVA